MYDTPESQCCLLVDLGEDLGVLEKVELLDKYGQQCIPSAYDITWLHAVSPTKATTHLFTDLDRATTPSGQKDPVSGLDRDGSDVAVLVASTGTHSDDGGFRERRLGGRRREEDTRGSFLVEA